MIGELHFREGDSLQAVLLTDDLRWVCDDRRLADDLNETFPPQRVEGESDLVTGRHLLYQTAGRVGAGVRRPAEALAVAAGG